MTTDLSIVISNYMTRPCGTGSRHVQGKNKAIAKLFTYPKDLQGSRSITIWSCKQHTRLAARKYYFNRTRTATTQPAEDDPEEGKVTHVQMILTQPSNISLTDCTFSPVYIWKPGLHSGIGRGPV